MKRFNITGVCVPGKHYMVDIKGKLNKISILIECGEYFAINRARQYGKTTTLNLLARHMENKHIVIKISFEGLGDNAFKDEKSFSIAFISLIETRLKQQNIDPIAIGEWSDNQEQVLTLDILSRRITTLINNLSKEVVLMIDEVDKSSNNQLFLHFLGMLRSKYLDREEGVDQTFKCVILAGVHDVKNLKLKLRPDEERKYNSPWNIAAEFNIEMAFSAEEILTMLEDYENGTGICMNKPDIAKRIYYWTSGYPVLVSYLCKYIDEDFDKKWTIEIVDKAVKKLIDPTHKTVLFDDLIKNLEINPDLYGFTERLILQNEPVKYNRYILEIDKGTMYGIFSNEGGLVKIHNRIYQEYIYTYMSGKLEVKGMLSSANNIKSNFIKPNGNLDMEKVLLKFQEFMRKEYSSRDEKFIEREGRLLFLSFIKPIINGEGFDFKEPQISEEKRIDVVITYRSEIHVVELKIWHGDEAHQNGLRQLCGYLSSMQVDHGYLVIFNFNKNKQYFKKTISFEGKDILAIEV